MAQRGPKPKPNEIKKLSGSRRYNKYAPKYSASARTRAPRGHLDAEARRFWNQYYPILAESGVISQADMALFELMASHYSMTVTARQKISEEGMIITDDDGHTRKHPLFQVWRDNAKGFKECAAEFGMTPSSRSRLKVPDRERSLAELLFDSLSDVADDLGGGQRE